MVPINDVFFVIIISLKAIGILNGIDRLALDFVRNVLLMESDLIVIFLRKEKNSFYEIEYEI